MHDRCIFGWGEDLYIMAEAEYTLSTVAQDADIVLLSCRTCSGEPSGRGCWLSMPLMKIRSSSNLHLSISHGPHDYHAIMAIMTIW